MNSQPRLGLEPSGSCPASLRFGLNDSADFHGRIRSLAAGLAMSAILVAFTPARAQQDFSKVEIKITAVAGPVHMLEGSGGNIGVSAGADGLLIVDDQFAPLAGKIDAALKSFNKGSLRFVLNTHWHGDHTGGNAHFGKQASIIAHSNVRARLEKREGTPIDPAALPVITFDDSLTVHFNGEEIRMLHLPPGHTDGDSVILFTKSKVVHMGDQFFSGRFPYIDLSSGGDVAGYMKNVETVIGKIPEDAKIIPGHGPLSTLGDLKTFLQMMKETTGLIRQGIADGKSIDQLKAAGLPEKWKSWGTGFINTSRWIEMVYNSYTRKP